MAGILRQIAPVCHPATRFQTSCLGRRKPRPGKGGAYYIRQNSLSYNSLPCKRKYKSGTGVNSITFHKRPQQIGRSHEETALDSPDFADSGRPHPGGLPVQTYHLRRVARVQKPQQILSVISGKPPAAKGRCPSESRQGPRPLHPFFAVFDRTYAEMIILWEGGLLYEKTEVMKSRDICFLIQLKKGWNVRYDKVQTTISVRVDWNKLSSDIGENRIADRRKIASAIINKNQFGIDGIESRGCKTPVLKKKVRSAVIIEINLNQIFNPIGGLRLHRNSCAGFIDKCSTCIVDKNLNLSPDKIL